MASHCGEAGRGVGIIQEAERQQVRPVAVLLEIVPMLEACNYAYDTLQMGIKANTLLLLF